MANLSNERSEEPKRGSPTGSAPERPPAAKTDNGAQEAAAAPNRPRLAPKVELSDEMKESGFADPQWLVQNDGAFLQLTELLYRIAEQANGEHSLDEIAQTVGHAINRHVTSDNVGQLISDRLIPLGVIVAADGTVAAPAGQAGPAARSPLAVNMKVRMVSPRFIEPITRLFKPLYLPPVLICILLAAAAAHIWLYFIHGVGAGVRQALDTPGLILAVLGIIVIATVFHEFGHATALQYGGGEVRGMGAGLYLIYPAFYTDVTDNYRLGRWARVRTDVGGFYFNLIFAMLMIGLFLLTGVEFLLLVVVLVDLEIIRQVLPLVRLDGYWILADMTGIPDLFSQMGPFIRSLLHIPGWKGRKLPNLKTWVKVVFAVYIIIVMPLLAFLLFVMIRTFPHLAATAWSSFQKQFSVFDKARQAADPLGMGASGVQMITLALPVVGLLYTVFNLGRRVATFLWNWSASSSAKRVVAVTGMGAIAAFLVFLWLPALPLPANAAGQQPASPLFAYTRSSFQPLTPQDTGVVANAFSEGSATSQPMSPRGAKATPTLASKQAPLSRGMAPDSATVNARHAASRPAPTSAPTQAVTAPAEVKTNPTPATSASLGTSLPSGGSPPSSRTTLPATNSRRSGTVPAAATAVPPAVPVATTGAVAPLATTTPLTPTPSLAGNGTAIGAPAGYRAAATPAASQTIVGVPTVSAVATAASTVAATATAVVGATPGSTPPPAVSTLAAASPTP